MSWDGASGTLSLLDLISCSVEGLFPPVEIHVTSGRPSITNSIVRSTTEKIRNYGRRPQLQLLGDKKKLNCSPEVVKEKEVGQ